MPKFRKKPVEVDAEQWFKNGDHSADYDRAIVGIDPSLTDGLVQTWTAEFQRENNWEGGVVRYFRRPEPQYAGSVEHEPCGRTWHEHGWIDTLEGGHTVCPGDYIITGVQGERYPCKPGIFVATYEPVE